MEPQAVRTFLILAAGNSTRFGSDKLREPIKGLTLPERAVDFAVKNGAERICVTLNRKAVMTDGYRVFHPILEDLTSRYWDGIEIEVAFQDENAYGPGAAITAWEGKIEDDFTVLFGDNFYEGTLPELSPEWTHFSYRKLGTNPRNLQLAAVVDNYIVEKPHAFLEGRFFCGFAHFPRDFWSTLPQLQKSGRGEYEITDMINLAGNTIAWDLDEIGIKWGDITYKSDIDAIERLVG